MTTSSANRRNNNARIIVATIPADSVLRELRRAAFTEEGARRFAVPRVRPELTSEVNWPLVAELLNRTAPA